MIADRWRRPRIRDHRRRRGRSPMGCKLLGRDVVSHDARWTPPPRARLRIRSTSCWRAGRRTRRDATTPRVLRSRRSAVLADRA
ncbi:hypothetical protein HBB16_20795 [Pseudonocardia sp. MCCB 268]|nr:hypothetical protein [Pseudonocardia cytotoxica]